MTIALLTDFGTTDSYVGVMKGVMATICPTAQVIDITHAIEPQNIRQGAFTLLNAYGYFPPDTIFLAVVDPGVGSTRRAVAVRAGGYTFVAPDNGLLSYVLQETPVQHAVELNKPAYRLTAVSNTFHGRDIFAPAASHLAAGVALLDIGTPIAELVELPALKLSIEGQIMIGEVLHIDHFGNIVTSIGRLAWANTERLTLNRRAGMEEVNLQAADVVITLSGQVVRGLAPSYSHTQPGDLLAMIGSSGYLEVAINQGNAAARLGTKIGDHVELRIS